MPVRDVSDSDEFDVARRGATLLPMCNLYTYRVMPEEMAGLMAHFKLIGRNWAEAMSRRNAPPEDVYPNRRAPVLVMQDGEPVVREDMLWGFPPFGGKGTYTTNFRNLNVNLWRPWLDREHRCVVLARASPTPSRCRGRRRMMRLWYGRSRRRRNPYGAPGRCQMTDKEAVDCCLAVVQMSNERRKARESFEWKLSIAFWTLIVLATDFLSRSKSTVGVSQWERFWFAFAALVIYFVFAIGLASAHAADGGRARHYWRQASALLSGSSSRISHYVGDVEIGVLPFYRSGLVTIWKSYGALFQCLATILLLAAFWCLGFA